MPFKKKKSKRRSPEEEENMERMLDAGSLFPTIPVSLEGEEGGESKKKTGKLGEGKRKAKRAPPNDFEVLSKLMNNPFGMSKAGELESYHDKMAMRNFNKR